MIETTYIIQPAVMTKTVTYSQSAALHCSLDSGAAVRKLFSDETAVEHTHVHATCKSTYCLATYSNGVNSEDSVHSCAAVSKLLSDQAAVKYTQTKASCKCPPHASLHSQTFVETDLMEKL